MEANSSLERLATQIGKELRKAPHCAVYAPELTRTWPRDGRRREPAEVRKMDAVEEMDNLRKIGVAVAKI